MALETGHKELANIILQTNLSLTVNKDLIVLAINNNMCSIVPQIRERLKRSGLEVATIQYMHNIAISEHKFSEKDIKIITEEINKLSSQHNYHNPVFLVSLTRQVSDLLSQEEFLIKNSPMIQAIIQKFANVREAVNDHPNIDRIAISTILPETNNSKTAFRYATEGIGRQCMIKQLLKAGASTTIPDKKNRTPLELIASSIIQSKDDVQAANLILKALHQETAPETFKSICLRCIDTAHEASNVKITELLLNYSTCSKDQLDILINKTLAQPQLQYPTTSMITILLHFQNSLEPAGSSYDATQLLHLLHLINSKKSLEEQEALLGTTTNK